jgi:hypothetical protein
MNFIFFSFIDLYENINIKTEVMISRIKYFNPIDIFIIFYFNFSI